MIQKIIRDGFILLLAVVGLWFILSKIIPPQKPLNNLVSREQEKKIADFLTRIIESQYKVIEDSAWDASLSEMTGRFKSKLPDSEYGYEIKILDEEIPNAFATLDGRIYFFKGMLDMAEKPEEIAAVLAHEIGHVEKKHVLNKLISEFGLTILTTVSTGGDMVLAREILLTLTRGAYSRSQENEADDFALELLYNSGINPKYLGIMFRKLKEEHPEVTSQIEILSTHPDIQSRIRKSLEYDLEGFEEIPLDSVATKDEPQQKEKGEGKTDN